MVNSSKDTGVPKALAISKVFVVANIPEAAPLGVTKFERVFASM
jgi:hypothetical protein